MKRLLIVLLAMTSTLAFAGKLVDARTEKEIVANCTKWNAENNCLAFDILLNHPITNTKEILARTTVHPLTNANEEFELNEKIKRFEFFPISHRAYDEDYHSVLMDVMDGTVGTLGVGGLTLLIFGLIEPATLPVGTTIIAAAAVVTVTPIIADVVSLPVRAIIKTAKLRKATLSEKDAFKALKIILSNEQPEKILGHKKFLRVVNAFKTIKQ